MSEPPTKRDTVQRALAAQGIELTDTELDRVMVLVGRATHEAENAGAPAYEADMIGTSYAIGYTVARRRPEPADSPRSLLVCPVHGIPDCSPLLNGCVIPNRIAAAWAGGWSAALAR